MDLRTKKTINYRRKNEVKFKWWILLSKDQSVADDYDKAKYVINNMANCEEPEGTI